MDTEEQANQRLADLYTALELYLRPEGDGECVNRGRCRTIYVAEGVRGLAVRCECFKDVFDGLQSLRNSPLPGEPR